MTHHMALPMDVKLMNSAVWLLVMVLVLSCVATGVRWAMRNPAFSIGQITVAGDTTHNSAASLRSSVQSKLQGNFFTMDLSAAQAAFQTAPWVKSAMVQREFPNSLRVTLKEYVPVARWGEDNAHMIDQSGKVFDAAAGDADDDDLPTLVGPEGRAIEVWAMYQHLKPLVAPLDAEIVELALLSRGNWRATLDEGALIELGQGTPEQLAARLSQFVSTASTVVARYQRPLAAIESADLRHAGGYALRLRGVATNRPEDATPSGTKASATARSTTTRASPVRAAVHR